MYNQMQGLSTYQRSYIDISTLASGRHSTLSITFFSFPFFGLKDPCSTLAIGRESQRLLKTRKLYFNDDSI